MLGLFKLAGAGLVSPGESALLVAEQDRLEHIVWNRRTIDRDRCLARAPRGAMNQAKKYFFADARFARNHHGGVGFGDSSREVNHPLGDRIFGNHFQGFIARGRSQPLAQARHQHFGLEGLEQIIGGALL